MKSDVFVDKRNDDGNMIGISDISEKYPPSFETEKSFTEKGSLDGNSLNSAKHLHKSLSHKSGDSEDNATIDDDHYEIFPDSSSRCIDAKDGDVSLDALDYVIEGILSPEVEGATSVATIRGTTSQGIIPEVMNSPKLIQTLGEVETEDIYDIEVSPQNNDQTSYSTNAKLKNHLKKNYQSCQTMKMTKQIIKEQMQIFKLN